MIYGLCAPKQSGKSTMANFITTLLPDLEVERMSFADPLKQMLMVGFGLSREQCYGSDEDKNSVIGDWGLMGEALQKKYGKQPNDPLSVRTLMQLFGTQIMRATFAEDIWVQLLVRKIGDSEADIIVVDDVRFLNEVKAIRSLGGKVIRMYRDINLENELAHESELELTKIPPGNFDFIVTKEMNADMDTLLEATRHFLTVERWYTR